MSVTCDAYNEEWGAWDSQSGVCKKIMAYCPAVLAAETPYPQTICSERELGAMYVIEWCRTGHN